jgi:hypothetical protein
MENEPVDESPESQNTEETDESSSEIAFGEVIGLLRELKEQG